jgi:CubicO group peptidase (beta-lactamase class C family)
MLNPVSRRTVLTGAIAAALFLAASPALLHAEQASPIAAALKPFVDSHTLAGAVTLAADKDKILAVDAVGFADIAAKRPMTKDALFWIASMSKPITATAFMMLVDEGKVSIDDPVEKYLPEFKGQFVVAEQDEHHVLLRTPVHPITVRNILSHTSGLPFKSPIEVPTLDLLPLATRVRSYAMLPLQFEPDSKYQYANAGINTAGRIIEVVSGMRYERFLQERLFTPIGMKDTTFTPNAAQIARIAKSYKPNAAKNDLEETPVTQLKYPLDDPSREPMPAGGLFSTAADLARFCQMILRGGELDGKRYLSEKSLRTMTSKQTGDLPNGYGLGWSTDKNADGPFGHGGAYSTNMLVNPGTGIIMIYLVQHAGYPNGDEGKKIQPAFQKAAAALAPKH